MQIHSCFNPFFAIFKAFLIFLRASDIASASLRSPLENLSSYRLSVPVGFHYFDLSFFMLYVTKTPRGHTSSRARLIVRQSSTVYPCEPFVVTRHCPLFVNNRNGNDITPYFSALQTSCAICKYTCTVCILYTITHPNLVHNLATVRRFPYRKGQMEPCYSSSASVRLSVRIIIRQLKCSQNMHDSNQRNIKNSVIIKKYISHYNRPLNR